ncbi:MAG TPA: hypothetical protein VKX31_07865, partial [Brumimicrobium sp.]|nr:hypothetical protein [Brumimicrobium sp.]
MKKLIIGLLLLVGFIGWGQQDTIQSFGNPPNQPQVITDSVTQYDQADRRFGMLQELIPTQKLFNRLLLEDTLNSVVWNTNAIRANEEFGATADHAYGLLYEMQLMSFDTSSVPNRMDVMHNAMDYMDAYEFEGDEYHYPIGVFDYKYNTMDENLNRKNGNINFKDAMYRPQNNRLELKERTATLVAPIFDLHGSQQMAIIFRKENFYSNYRNADEVKSITIEYNRIKRKLEFGETFYFQPQDEKNQKFHIKLTYNDGTIYKALFTIRTPYLSLANGEKNQLKKSEFKCFDSDEITQEVGAFGGRELKLEWCLQPRCGWDGRIYKPYILITGYRPPIFGQKFSVTWKYYNDEHNNMLSDLRNNNYDVFVIKFNMNWRYEMLGIIEA